MKSIPTLTLVVLALASGCATASPSVDRASLPRHQWTDAEWYGQAISEAMDAYEAEVELAAGRSYASAAEAEAVSMSHGESHFDAHLTAALDRYGLTHRGLGLYARRHPEFAAAQEAINTVRMESIRDTHASIATRVRPDRTLVAFESPEEETGRLASRK